MIASGLQRTRAVIQWRKPTQSHGESINVRTMKAKVAQSCPTPYNPMDHRVHGILQARIRQWVVWIVFPCSRGIFLTQRWNPGLLHGRWILYQLSHKVSPRILEWVAFPFSSRFSQPRNWTGVSCIAGGFVTYWAIRETISTLLCFKSQLHKHVYSHNLWFKHHLFIDSKGHRSQFKGKLNQISNSQTSSGYHKALCCVSLWHSESILSPSRFTACCRAGPHLFMSPSITWTTCNSLSAGTHSTNAKKHRYQKRKCLSTNPTSMQDHTEKPT